MAAIKDKESRSNFLLGLYPVPRILISIAVAICIYFLLPANLGILVSAMVSWISLALTFLVFSWIILFNRPVSQIKKIASKEDGSKIFVFVMILVSSFASMFTVLLLVISQTSEKIHPAIFIPVAVVGMLLSWVMVHTVFTFHYAHMYYDVPDKGSTKVSGGLDFPNEDEPDYIDFAYFSFVIGCTFQVSDVEISSRKIRRMALLHGLLSFGLNTFVVALTINLIAGLQK